MKLNVLMAWADCSINNYLYFNWIIYMLRMQKNVSFKKFRRVYMYLNLISSPQSPPNDLPKYWAGYGPDLYT